MGALSDLEMDDTHTNEGMIRELWKIYNDPRAKNHTGTTTFYARHERLYDIVFDNRERYDFPEALQYKMIEWNPRLICGILNPTEGVRWEALKKNPKLVGYTSHCRYYAEDVYIKYVIGLDWKYFSHCRYQTRENRDFVLNKYGANSVSSFDVLNQKEVKKYYDLVTDHGAIEKIYNQAVRHKFDDIAVYMKLKHGNILT